MLFAYGHVITHYVSYIVYTIFITLNLSHIIVQSSIKTFFSAAVALLFIFTTVSVITVRLSIS